MFKFVVDRVIRGRAYPALTTHHTAEPYQLSWREFGKHYPGTVPVELINHCADHNYACEIKNVDQYVESGDCDQHWYPVQWGFFDHGIDYIGLLPTEITQILKNNTHDKLNLRLLFYYHEADNPIKIKLRLDRLCQQNGLNSQVYRLVSGNTASDNIKGCVHFCDHELLYYNRNSQIVAKPVEFLKTGVPMRRHFLLLSRTHKWWRAAVLTALKQQGILNSAVWSYNTLIQTDDTIDDCPIELDTVDIRADGPSIYKIRAELDAFLKGGPYMCDTLSSDQHNDHSVHVQEHYDSTACSIVLETHFDAEQSGGAFLTEKTFKCIKHGHPFIIVGCAGSVAALRDLGYRTFDSVIDTSYDRIADNTQRFLAVVRSIHKLSLVDPNDLYTACVEDLAHNQRLFLASKWPRLNTLYERLHNE